MKELILMIALAIYLIVAIPLLIDNYRIIKRIEKYKKRK
ncbi:hypothetical protein IGJ94_000258 [Enterococcus sp. AZ153]